MSAEKKHRNGIRPIGISADGEKFDEETGEIIEASHSEGFLKFFESELWRFISVANTPIKVFVILVRKMNKRTNYCKITQKQLAEELNCSERQVRRATNELEGAGLIHCGHASYQVNPSFVWLGDEESRIVSKHVYRKNVDKKLYRSI